jgi:phosphoribosylaminoimidazolecarboxamide formyltransferase/IMP cyclohydrolase
VASGASDADIIEKIDIGGISLIRAGAKNFNDVVIVPSKAEYGKLLDIVKAQGAETTLEQRKEFATCAFGVSSHYDTAIHNWFKK